MNATKHTITITVEVLSIDAAPALICDVNEQLRREVITGNLTYLDGDSVDWYTDSEPVEF